MLENKVVLITGAAKGMGESHAQVCAGYGAIVVLTDLDQKGEAVAQSIRDGGGRASFYQLNVTSPDNWKSVIDSIN
jgi:NAD(P)-dependent dehydrogenase (short-subunit alcohol dehydrogenase family)